MHYSIKAKENYIINPTFSLEPEGIMNDLDVGYAILA